MIHLQDHSVLVSHAHDALQSSAVLEIKWNAHPLCNGNLHLIELSTYGLKMPM